MRLVAHAQDCINIAKTRVFYEYTLIVSRKRKQHQPHFYEAGAARDLLHGNFCT